MWAFNEPQQDFTNSEAFAIYAEVKPMMEEEAKKRQGERTDKHQGKFPESSKGQTRDKAAEVKVRAERKAGEMLAQLNTHERGGDRKSKSAVDFDSGYRDVLRDNQIPDATAHRWQQLAMVALEIEAFEARLAKERQREGGKQTHSNQYVQGSANQHQPAKNKGKAAEKAERLYTRVYNSNLSTVFFVFNVQQIPHWNAKVFAKFLYNIRVKSCHFVLRPTSESSIGQASCLRHVLEKYFLPFIQLLFSKQHRKTIVNWHIHDFTPVLIFIYVFRLLLYTKMLFLAMWWYFCTIYQILDTIYLTKYTVRVYTVSIA